MVCTSETGYGGWKQASLRPSKSLWVQTQCRAAILGTRLLLRFYGMGRKDHEGWKSGMTESMSTAEHRHERPAPSIEKGSCGVRVLVHGFETTFALRLARNWGTPAGALRVPGHLGHGTVPRARTDAGL